MRTHFVTKYIGQKQRANPNFLRAGEDISNYFSENGFTGKFTDSGFKLIKGQTKVMFAYDRNAPIEEVLHEIDIDGEEKEIMDIRKTLEEIYLSNEFKLLFG